MLEYSACVIAQTINTQEPVIESLCISNAACRVIGSMDLRVLIVCASMCASNEGQEKPVYVPMFMSVLICFANNSWQACRVSLVDVYAESA